MPKSTKQKISHFFADDLRAPLKNIRNSWGAFDISHSTVFLRVWRDEIGPYGMLVLNTKRIDKHKPGFKERKKHIDAIKNGMPAYGILCAKNPKKNEREIKDYDDKKLLAFGPLKEIDGIFYASIANEVDVKNFTHKSSLPQDIGDIYTNENDPTTREILADARVGQGKFRDNLLRKWSGMCAVSGCTVREAIRASHMKPWRHSTNKERLDADNGIPLIATLDALFDAGLITFDDDGKMLVSKKIDATQRGLLKIPAQLQKRLTEKQLIFLRHHRKEIFDK